MLASQGKSVARSVKTISVTKTTYSRWLSEHGGMKKDQVKQLKQLDVENFRLRRTVSDLTLDEQILTEAAKENF